MLKDSIFLPDLPKEITQPIFWTGLKYSADSLAIACAIKNTNRLLVAIVPDNQTATRLERELTFFLTADLPILHFPDWEILPYDIFSPLPEIISERLKTLSLLPETNRGVLIVSIPTLMHRLSPREHILAHSFFIEVGGIFNCNTNRIKLESVGYQCVSQVYQHAEFAVRGSIVDLFPMGSKLPYRIELFDDKIESIRTFDPDTQSSLKKINKIQLFPAREFPFTDNSIKNFRQAFRNQFPKISHKNIFYLDVSKGMAPSGIEYYFPLFTDSTETLFDYLPDTSILMLFEGYMESAKYFCKNTEERFSQRRHNIDRPLLEPKQIILSTAEFQAKIQKFYKVIVGQQKIAPKINFNCQLLPDLKINLKLAEPASKLLNFLAKFNGKVLFVAETAGHREAMLDMLRPYKIILKQLQSWQNFLDNTQTTEPCLIVAPLEHGVLLANPLIAIITENQLNEKKTEQRKKSKKSATKELENIFNNLNELTLGSPVVHQQYGVGRYLGLQTIAVGEIKTEFLVLQYAGDDKIYVPVSSLHIIGRYSGVNLENAPLHKLGSNRWNKAKKKAMVHVRDVAVELLDIHAMRAAKQGYAFKIKSSDYSAFSAQFPFQETPDQQTAIDEIYRDMSGQSPMDRIICGDVGFGKTEIAMRAAFIAVQSNNQVAVLVPTTLLAQQHFQNFRDRFADWPIRIEVLSRFVPLKQQKTIIEGLGNGSVDLIIGTHKLFSKTLKYKNLRLIIIDEEHRFGVRQKEYFKKLRHELDLLTLTATPIPRTLNMAMSALRDISIIATPPINRHPIKTFINEWINSQIQEACQREIKRGGQVFFVHNNIKTISQIAEDIKSLVPEAKIQISHGQISEHKLEKIMLDFYHQRFNLLLSTTIIESGIDIPNANTIIINRADKLGLAQLHQLRGRVGRSHHRSYAYLIIPPQASISNDAKKRLEAIKTSSELGAGFMLSSHDLEIRGAGELLGNSQSGQIQEIGFTLYAELLERAVTALKSGKQPVLDAPMETGPEVDLQAQALIPEDYLPDIHARLVLYKRIASTKTMTKLHALKIEMIDRFGMLPEATKTLFSVTEIKQTAHALGVKKIDIHVAGGRIVFNAKPKINSPLLVNLIQTQPQCYKFDGASILKFNKSLKTLTEKISFITDLLITLKI